MEMSVDNTNSSNLQDQVKFKATENSAKLFSMLSSFLYSNKELAVLHELSSNALDAHRMVGKVDVPIEVHLPNSLYPNLKISDCGPGLSHDNVIKFLTTYGESNKTSSSDMIGGYGIGAKSPAAVTDTWQLISKHEGIGIQYIVAVDPSGVPSLSKLREFDTTESGLDVIVPVHTSKIRVWEDAAREAYQFYPIKPNVKGAKYPITHEKESTIIEFPGLGRCVEQQYSKGNVTAILGVRGYKVDLNQVKDKVSDLHYSILAGVGSVLTFGINDLDVDLSREGIRYSAKTIDCLASRISQLANMVEDHIKKEIAPVSMMIETRVKVKELYNSFGQIVFKYSMDKGINSSGDLGNLGFPITGSHTYKVGFAGKIATLNTKYTCGRTHAVSMINYDYRAKSDNIKISIRLSAFDTVVFCVNDGPGTASRIRKQMEDDRSKIFIIAESFAEFGPEVVAMSVKASSFPMPPKRAIVRSPVIKSDLYIKNGGRFLKISDDHLTLKINNGGSEILWTEFTNGVSCSGMDSDKVDFIGGIVDISPIIIGIKKGKNKPALLSTIKSVDVRYEEIIAQLNTERQAYVDGIAIGEMKASLLYKKFVGTITSFPTHSSMYKVIAEIGKMESIKTKLHISSYARNKVDLTGITVSDSITKCSKGLAELGTRYPMIPLCVNEYSRIEGVVLKSVVDYVNLIEGEQK